LYYEPHFFSPVIPSFSSICVYQGGIGENLVYDLKLNLKKIPDIDSIKEKFPGNSKFIGGAIPTKYKKLEDHVPIIETNLRLPTVLVGTGTREKRDSEIAWRLFTYFGFPTFYLAFSGPHEVSSEISREILNFFRIKIFE
jgi:hypothetical protein